MSRTLVRAFHALRCATVRGTGSMALDARLSAGLFALLDASDGPQALVDPNGLLWRANPAFAAAAGKGSAAELVGRDLGDVLGGRLLRDERVAIKGGMLFRLVRPESQDRLVSMTLLPPVATSVLLVELLGGEAGVARDGGVSASPGSQRSSPSDLEAMSAVADALAEAFNLEQVRTVVVRRLPATVGACAGALGLQDDDGVLVVTHGDGDGDGRSGVRALLTEVVRTGLAVVVALHPPERPRAAQSAKASAQTRTWTVLPLIADDLTFGAWAVAFSDPESGCAGRMPMLEAIAGLCAQALARARWFDRDRAVGLSLQRALTPPGLPTVPGLRLEGRCLPAEFSQVGGDFFEVLPLPGGRVAVTLGDVAGHGPAAGAGMSQVSTALRAYALDGHSPTDVVHRTNSVLMSRSEPTFITCCYLEIDTATGSACLVMAGHLPPLLFRAGGKTEFLTLPTGLPLGVEQASRYVGTPLSLSRGDALLLYTDGLVESREVCLTDGLAALLLAAQVGISDEPAVLLDQLLSSVRPRTSRDDVALLLVRFDGTTRPELDA